MAEFSGGRASGGRRAPKEPNKKPAATPKAISLDNEESVIAENLLHVSDLYWALAALPSKTIKSIREDFTVNDEGTKVTFATDPRRSVLHFKPVPGLEIEKAEERKQQPFTVEPAKLLEYLRSEPVKALRKKLLEHDHATAGDDYAFGNKDKLAGLNARARLEIDRAESMMEELQKKMVVEKFRGRKDNDKLAVHKDGGPTV